MRAASRLPVPMYPQGRGTSGYKDYPLHGEDFIAIAVCALVLAAAIVLAVVG